MIIWPTTFKPVKIKSCNRAIKQKKTGNTRIEAMKCSDQLRNKLVSSDRIMKKYWKD